MSILFAFMAAVIVFFSDLGFRVTGASALVSSSVSAERWLRTCVYAGPEGLVSIEMDAVKSCPAAAPSLHQPAITHHAMLQR